MVDNSEDQSSRWSSAFQGNTTDQWIILRLESLSVLGEFRRLITSTTLISFFSSLARKDNIRKGERDRMSRTSSP
jgi:hypothetical protein